MFLYHNILWDLAMQELIVIFEVFELFYDWTMNELCFNMALMYMHVGIP